MPENEGFPKPQSFLPGGYLEVNWDYFKIRPHLEFPEAYIAQSLHTGIGFLWSGVCFAWFSPLPCLTFCGDTTGKYCWQIASYTSWAPTIVINGVSYNPYKWPKINGQLGLFHPTYRSSFTRFITGDGAHLVYTYYINTYPNISVLQCWVVYPPGNEHISSGLALLKIIFFFSEVGYVSSCTEGN